MNPWEKAIWGLSIGLTVALLIKLVVTRLYKVYQLLFAYLTADFLASFVGIFLSYHSSFYGYYYFSAQTVKILIGSFMLREIFGLALERTPALAQFGRNFVGYLLAAAALIPLVALLFRSPPAHPYLKTFLLFEQTLNGTVAIFLIILSLFMAWFPVRMRRNVIVYIGGFIVWSLSRSAAVHLGTLFPGNAAAIRAINTAQLCISVLCLCWWLMGMKPQGEARTAVVGHLWNRAEAERLTQQLDALNDSLARSRKNK